MAEWKVSRWQPLGFGPSLLLSTHEAPAGIYHSTKERGKKKSPCCLSGRIVKEAGEREQHHGGGGGVEMRATSLVFVQFCHRASIFSTTLENVRTWSVI